MENKCSVKEGAEKKSKCLIIIEEWGKQGWFPAPEEPFLSEPAWQQLINKEREKTAQAEVALAAKGSSPNPHKKIEIEYRNRSVLIGELLAIMGNFTEKPRVKAMQQEAPVENEISEAQPTSPQLPNHPAVSEVERPPPYAKPPPPYHPGGGGYSNMLCWNCGHISRYCRGNWQPPQQPYLSSCTPCVSKKGGTHTCPPMSCSPEGPCLGPPGTHRNRCLHENAN